MASWVRTKGWLKDYVPPRQEEALVAVEDKPADQGQYGVVWKKRKCPYCQSEKFSTGRTIQESNCITRYHKCLRCKKTFRSHERD
jgi:hypothetical protein